MNPRRTAGGVHERTAELRARRICGCSRAAGPGERDRAGIPDPTTGPVEDALVVLESDLSYLEDLPAGRVAPAGDALGELGERLERVIASLASPA